MRRSMSGMNFLTQAQYNNNLIYVSRDSTPQSNLDANTTNKQIVIMWGPDQLTPDELDDMIE